MQAVEPQFAAEMSASKRQRPSQPEASRPGCLLTMAAYNGTLAAVRELGRGGIPVTIADSASFARARWSRWVTTRAACPNPSQGGAAFVERLLHIGRQAPGQVIYPTSDDTAFLYSMYQEELRQVFRTNLPPLESIYALLNKNLLLEHARAVGIDCPTTHLVQTKEEALLLSRGAKFPLLLKPQTQIQFATQMKGFYAQDPDSLSAVFHDFTTNAHYGEEVRAYDPGVGAPLLQQYHSEAIARIYSLAGFIDSSGRVAARGSAKVFQRPRKFGVGICFEAAPIIQPLLDKIRSLCLRIGYHGVFEIEFIESGGRSLLIDFNPRFYGQMGFEIARGLPLARLAYESALGNHDWVRETLENDAREEGFEWSIYCHGLSFKLALLLSRLSRRMPLAEYRAWREWIRRNQHTVFDSVHSRDDLAPGVIDVFHEIYKALRHPRSYFRSLVPSSGER